MSCTYSTVTCTTATNGIGEAGAHEVKSSEGWKHVHVGPAQIAYPDFIPSSGLAWHDLR